MVRSPTPVLEALEGDQLKVVFGDILDLKSLRAAMAGLDGVFHVAAPNHINLPKKQLYDAIIQGTRNVIQCSLQAGVRRLIMTSSCSAAGLRSSISADGLIAINEESWENKVKTPLLKAKIIAEKEAFSTVRSQEDQTKNIEFVSVLLPALLGPHFFRPTPQIALYQKLALGKIAPIPHLGFHILDVRDAAWGHILAYERGESLQRYILAGEYTTTYDLKKLVADHCPKMAKNLRIVPHWLVASFVPFDALNHLLTGKPREITWSLVQDFREMYQLLDGQKAKSVLGFSPRYTALESIVATFQWIEFLSRHKLDRPSEVDFSNKIFFAPKAIDVQRPRPAGTVGL
jgi:dihydroflavonol-4-reductase